MELVMQTLFERLIIFHAPAQGTVEGVEGFQGIAAKVGKNNFS